MTDFLDLTKNYGGGDLVHKFAQIYALKAFLEGFF